MTFKIYVAGPMTSVGQNFNVPLFDHVSARLRAAGCTVFNPADLMRERLGELKFVQTLPKQELVKMRKALLREELLVLIDWATHLLLLPGWERSTGASAERAIAIAYDIPVHLAPDVILVDDHGPLEIENLKKDG